MAPVEGHHADRRGGGGPGLDHELHLAPERVRQPAQPALPAAQHRRGVAAGPVEFGEGAVADRMGLEAELGDHPEVAAPAAAQGPVQPGVTVGGDLADGAVGGDHPGAREPVGGGAVRPRGQPETAAEGEPGDADGGAQPGRDAQTPPGERGVHVAQPGSRADPHTGRCARAPAGPLDRDRCHGPGVQHQARGPGGPARVAVPAAARYHRGAGAAGEVQADGHVARVRRIGHRARRDGVVPGLEQLPCLGVVRVAREHHPPVDPAGEGAVVRAPGRRADGGEHGRGRAPQDLAAMEAHASFLPPPGPIGVKAGPHTPGCPPNGPRRKRFGWSYKQFGPGGGRP